jgi:hypothetical protein
MPVGPSTPETSAHGRSRSGMQPGYGARAPIYRCPGAGSHHRRAVTVYPQRFPANPGATSRVGEVQRGAEPAPHEAVTAGVPPERRRGSQPVSRILSVRGPDGHPSGAAVADDLGAVYPRTRAGRPRTSAREPEGSLFDLAPGGVYPADRIAPAAGGLLHHRFTLTTASGGGLFSVALSRGSPRVGVTDHPALWSPDFPRTRAGRGSATVWPTPPLPLTLPARGGPAAPREPTRAGARCR